jgi:predicted hydrolase (HD superfamily)
VLTSPLVKNQTAAITTCGGKEKRFKEKAFAAAVNRDEIMEAMQMAGVELEEIMLFIIERQGAVK